MEYKTIVFTYTGEIGKNYGVDGTAIVQSGVEFTPENIKDEGIAKVWVKEGFAVYKDETKDLPKDELVEEIKYEDVKEEELIKEPELTSQEQVEEIKKNFEQEDKPFKKRGRPSRK